MEHSKMNKIYINNIEHYIDNTIGEGKWINVFVHVAGEAAYSSCHSIPSDWLNGRIVGYDVRAGGNKYSWKHSAAK